MNYYGPGSPEEVKDLIVWVCSKFHTANRRVPMVAAIAAVETQFGTYPDTTVKTGTGILQFDPLTFDECKLYTRPEYKEIVFREFGVDVDLVDYCCLRYSVFLSIIFGVLQLLRRKEALPFTIKGMCKYWKTFWNTKEGKGDEQDFYDSYNTWKYIIEGEK